MLMSLQSAQCVYAVLLPGYAIKDSSHGHDGQIAQGLVAIALPLSLLTAAILHKRHQAQKRQRQIAQLERLWQRSPNDKLL